MKISWHSICLCLDISHAPWGQNAVVVDCLENWECVVNVSWASGPAVSAAGHCVGALTHHGAAAGNDRPATEAGSCARRWRPRLSTRSGQKGELFIGSAQHDLSSFSSSDSSSTSSSQVLLFLFNSFLFLLSHPLPFPLSLPLHGLFLTFCFGVNTESGSYPSFALVSYCGEAIYVFTSLFTELELMILNALDCDVVLAHSSEYWWRLFLLLLKNPYP